MSIKITAWELLFSCVAVPKMIQYYLEIGYLFGVLNERNILEYVSIARPFLLAQERFFVNYSFKCGEQHFLQGIYPNSIA